MRRAHIHNHVHHRRNGLRKADVVQIAEMPKDGRLSRFLRKYGLGSAPEPKALGRRRKRSELGSFDHATVAYNAYVRSIIDDARRHADGAHEHMLDHLARKFGPDVPIVGRPLRNRLLRRLLHAVRWRR